MGFNLGAFAGGAAQGIVAGTNIANQAAARENEARRLAIMENGAKLDTEVKQRALDRDKRQEAVYGELAQLIEQYGGGASAGPEAANLTPEQKVSYGLHRNAGLMRNPQFLNSGASLFLKAQMPEGVQWLQHASSAAKENTVEMTQALLGGDTDNALRMYNAGGDRKAQAIDAVVGEDGKPSGKYRITMADGQATEIDPKSLYRSLLSPDAFSKMQLEEKKAEAQNNYYNAQADYLRGRNITAENVAQTRADATTTAAETRADGKGRGKGGKGGGDDGPDMLDATRRVSIAKDVDEFARENFGTPDPLNAGKSVHNENSKRVSGVAAQLVMAAENGGRPMTIQDAARLAAEGRRVMSAVRVDRRGRLVTEDKLDFQGVQYPLGSATRPVSKGEAVQLLDTYRAAAQKNQAQVDEAALRSADDVQALAKAAGISVDDAVANILGRPAGATPGEKAPATQTGKAGAGGGTDPKAPPGLVEKGNIDLTKRKVLKNADGSISTESSITITEDWEGKKIAINIPTVIDGKRYSEKEAIAHYRKSGEHLGKFSTLKEAESAAENVHLEQQDRYVGSSPDKPAAIKEARALDGRIKAMRDRGIRLPESGKRQLQQLEQARAGINVTPDEVTRDDAQQQLTELEATIARLKRTDTGVDRTRATTISSLERRAAGLRAKLK